jgi:hypothetical protein
MKTNTIDFRGFKQSEMRKFFRQVLGYPTQHCKMLAHMISKSDKKIFTQDELAKELDKAFMIRDISKEAEENHNDFKFSNGFDQVQLDYSMFLNRKDHTRKDFLDMDKKEWSDYLCKQWKYKKNTANLIAISMVEYLNGEYKKSKRPLHPLTKHPTPPMD